MESCSPNMRICSRRMGKRHAPKSSPLQIRTLPHVLIACPILLAAVLPVLAHHSFEAEYDFNKTLKVTGIVTKMEWMNPHAHFYVDVKDASGKVTNWNFELGAIPVLLKQG